MSGIHDGAAMSFEEIGQHLGITGEGASFLYRSALKKLRRKRGAIEAIKAMAVELDRDRTCGVIAKIPQTMA